MVTAASLGIPHEIHLQNPLDSSMGSLSHFIGAFWPSDLVMDEVMENMFAFDLSEELVKDRLVRAGFEFSQSYQKILDDEATS